MTRLIIVVPGWPTTKNPGRMPFFHFFAEGLAKEVAVEVVVLESLIGALRRRDVRFRPDVRSIENFAVRRFFVLNLRSSWLWEIQMSALARVYAWRFRDARPVVVNSHFAEVCFFGDALSGLLGGRHIMTEHASDFGALESHANIKMRSIGRILQHADAVVAVSGGLARSMERLFPKLRGQIHVIPNGVTPTVISLNEEHDSAERPFRFIFVGHLIDRKRIRQLVKTFLSLDTDLSAELLVVGDGPLRAAIQDEIVVATSDRLRVRLLGQLENHITQQEMAQSDVLVLPSSNESFGIVVAEALALGTACLVSRSGGPEYFVEQGKDGVQFDVDDFDQLAEHLLNFIERKYDFDRATLLRRNKDRFHWSAVARQYKALM